MLANLASFATRSLIPFACALLVPAACYAQPKCDTIERELDKQSKLAENLVARERAAIEDLKNPKLEELYARMLRGWGPEKYFEERSNWDLTLSCLKEEAELKYYKIGVSEEKQLIENGCQRNKVSSWRLEQVKQDSKALLNLARATPKPTLFVEGATDATIVEAAWTVFFPNEPMPVKVIAAGGTKEMGSLAGKGRALREVLGEQAVLVLADNDSAGRQLTEDGHIRKGGTWRQLPNGVHWCLLRPTAAFAAAMKAHNVPTDYWPFTIEAGFSPALRRQAEAAGVWRFSGTPQAELLDNPDLARRLFALVPKLGPDDDAYWYLMAPLPEAKETFAAWVTDPKQRSEGNYAALEEIVRGLRAVLAPRSDDSEATIRARGAA